MVLDNINQTIPYVIYICMYQWSHQAHGVIVLYWLMVVRNGRHLEDSRQH